MGDAGVITWLMRGRLRASGERVYTSAAMPSANTTIEIASRKRTVDVLKVFGGLASRRAGDGAASPGARTTNDGGSSATATDGANGSPLMRRSDGAAAPTI